MWCILGNRVDCIRHISALFFKCTPPSPFQEYVEFILGNYSPPLCISSWQRKLVDLGKGNACWQPKTKQQKGQVSIGSSTKYSYVYCHIWRIIKLKIFIMSIKMSEFSALYNGSICSLLYNYYTVESSINADLSKSNVTE